uniref:Uncharacterized protein n=1 Tax=Plectus sambesii TaxID=2011161 RepID=A0A914XU00_9BILA
MDGGRDQPLRRKSNDRHGDQIVIKRNRLKSDCFQISLYDALDPNYHFANIGGVSYHKDSFPHADKHMFIVGRRSSIQFSPTIYKCVSDSSIEK